MADVSRYLDKTYEGKEFSELADATVDALRQSLKATPSIFGRRSTSKRFAISRRASTCCGLRRS
jgi:hypothetical protein